MLTNTQSFTQRSAFKYTSTKVEITELFLSFLSFLIKSMIFSVIRMSLKVKTLLVQPKINMTEVAKNVCLYNNIIILGFFVCWAFRIGTERAQSLKPKFPKDFGNCWGLSFCANKWFLSSNPRVNIPV